MFDKQEHYRRQIEEIASKKDKLEVRYIKLGKGGNMFATCLENNMLYIGFNTHLDEVRRLSNEARDPSKTELVKKEIHDHWIKKCDKTLGTASNFTNRLLEVAQDQGNTLWFTIENRKLFYGLSDGKELERFEPWVDNGFNSGSAKKMKYGWCNVTINGDVLDISKISGALTKTQATQGTIANISPGPSKYLISLILGEPLELKIKAENARTHLVSLLAEIIKDFQPSEFEVLVDLIFSNSGWKRDGELGGNIKFVDVTLKLPTTGETAGVQVKTKSDKKQAQKYLDEDFRGMGFDKFFYVYHSGSGVHKDDVNYHSWCVKTVAEKSIDAGLTQWIIDRAYR